MASDQDRRNPFVGPPKTLDVKKSLNRVFGSISRSRIVLIDGPHLARLMIRYNVGCRDEEIIHLKKLDEDFFEPT